MRSISLSGCGRSRRISTRFRAVRGSKDPWAQIYAARYESSGLDLVEGRTTEDVVVVVGRLGTYRSNLAGVPL